MITPLGSSVFEAAIPPQLITPLAEFVFNLSTCSIPPVESTAPKSEHANHEVHKMQSDYLRNTILKVCQQNAVNATTWARCEFFNCYLLHNFPIPEPYDGLDAMLLLAWIVKAFSMLDSHNEPMVLHYWDLSIENVMVNGENRIWYLISAPSKSNKVVLLIGSG